MDLARAAAAVARTVDLLVLTGELYAQAASAQLQSRSEALPPAHMGIVPFACRLQNRGNGQSNKNLSKHSHLPSAPVLQTVHETCQRNGRQDRMIDKQIHARSNKDYSAHIFVPFVHYTIHKRHPNRFSTTRRTSGKRSSLPRASNRRGRGKRQERREVLRVSCRPRRRRAPSSGQRPIPDRFRIAPTRNLSKRGRTAIVTCYASSLRLADTRPRSCYTDTHFESLPQLLVLWCYINCSCPPASH